jgi:hypothetical protein
MYKSCHDCSKKGLVPYKYRAHVSREITEARIKYPGRTVALVELVQSARFYGRTGKCFCFFTIIPNSLDEAEKGVLPSGCLAQAWLNDIHRHQ